MNSNTVLDAFMGECTVTLGTDVDDTGEGKEIELWRELDRPLEDASEDNGLAAHVPLVRLPSMLKSSAKPNGADIAAPKILTGAVLNVIVATYSDADAFWTFRSSINRAHAVHSFALLLCILPT